MYGHKVRYQNKNEHLKTAEEEGALIYGCLHLAQTDTKVLHNYEANSSS